MRALSLLLPALLAGCSGGDDTDSADTDVAATYGLTLTGLGYDPHEGQTITAALYDADGEVVGGTQSIAVSGATFTLDFGAVLTEGASYTVGWYADMNGNASCDEVPDDHVWSRDAEAVSGDVAVEHTHATDFAACPEGL